MTIELQETINKQHNFFRKFLKYQLKSSTDIQFADPLVEEMLAETLEDTAFRIFVRSQLSKGQFSFEDEEMFEEFATALEQDKSFQDQLNTFIFNFLDGYVVEHEEFLNGVR